MCPPLEHKASAMRTASRALPIILMCFVAAARYQCLTSALSSSYSPQPISNTSAILAQVDGLRAAHSAPPLIWSDILATAAQQWANTLAAQDRLDHSDLTYGENIAVTWNLGTPTANVAAAVTIWYSEGSNYDWSRPSNPDQVDLHFTQLVWVSSVNVGAGVSIADATGHTYVVMEFDPPGNFIDQFRANVLPPVMTPPPNVLPPVMTPPHLPTSALPPHPDMIPDIIPDIWSPKPQPPPQQRPASPPLPKGASARCVPTWVHFAASAFAGAALAIALAPQRRHRWW